MHGSCWLRVKAEFLMNGLATSALIDSREAPGFVCMGVLWFVTRRTAHIGQQAMYITQTSHTSEFAPQIAHMLYRRGGGVVAAGGGALFLATTMRTGPLRRGRKKALLRVSAASAFAHSNCQARRGRPTAPFLPWCATAARSPVSAADFSAPRLLDGTARS